MSPRPARSPTCPQPSRTLAPGAPRSGPPAGPAAAGTPGYRSASSWLQRRPGNSAWQAEPRRRRRVSLRVPALQQRGPSLGAPGRWPRGWGSWPRRPGVDRWGRPRATPPASPAQLWPGGWVPGPAGSRAPRGQRGVGRNTRPSGVSPWVWTSPGSLAGKSCVRRCGGDRILGRRS